MIKPTLSKESLDLPAIKMRPFQYHHTQRKVAFDQVTAPYLNLTSAITPPFLSAGSFFLDFRNFLFFPCFFPLCVLRFSRRDEREDNLSEMNASIGKYSLIG